MVGVAGPSCSGKTTLAENLEARLGDRAANFPFDDLLIGVDALIARGTTDWESPDLYRWEDYRRHMLALKAGEETVLSARSPASEAEGVTSRLIRPRPVLVAAGFLALYDGQVNELFDTTVFIDLPEAEMLRRRRVRSNPDNPWDTETYIAGSLTEGTRRHVSPQRELAEHVLDGTRTQDELLAELTEIIAQTEAAAAVPQTDG